MADRLISADEAMKILCADCDIKNLCKEGPVCMEGMAMANLPTVEAEPITLESAIDFLHSIGWLQEHDRILTEYCRPIVPCIECKHHEDEEPGMVYCSNIVGGWVRNDFFCADGKRMDEVEE